MSTSLTPCLSNLVIRFNRIPEEDPGPGQPGTDMTIDVTR